MGPRLMREAIEKYVWANPFQKRFFHEEKKLLINFPSHHPPSLRISFLIHLSSNIKTAMHPKGPMHHGIGHHTGSHQRGKSRLEEDYLKSIMREGVQHRKENLGLSGIKDKKAAKGDYSLFNSRYEIDKK